MDIRIVTKYVTDVIDQAPHNREEAIDEITNVLHIAISGNSKQSKALILEALLTMEDEPMNELDCCLNWLKLQSIMARESEGSIYIIANPHYELQLSSEEVSYRAELYKETMEEPN